MTIGVAAGTAGRQRSSSHGEPRSALVQALERAGRCADRPSAPGWSLAQVLMHCAQAIEYSMAGFPRPRSRLVQVTIGRAVKVRFLRRGAMIHNRQAPIPGAPRLPEGLSRDEGLARLDHAVRAFEAYEGPLAPHFTYGPATREEYEALHAMHIADHLSVFDEARPAS
jgi:hypothetical protein